MRTPSPRFTLLQNLMPLLKIERQEGANPTIVHRQEPRLRLLTAEPVYAIPTTLLEILHKNINDWFSPEELKLERQFSQCCVEFHSIALWQGEFVRHAFFTLSPNLQNIIVNDDFMRFLVWDKITTKAAVRRALRVAKERTEPVRHRREAYLGWLMINPTFLAERDALRARWGAKVSDLGFMPQFPVRQTLQIYKLLPGPSATEMEELADDFSAFYERWDLLGLVTWDLPLPKMANLGGPVSAGKLSGLDDRPTVLLPRTLRVPARYSLADLHKSKVENHLEEWHAVEYQQSPGHLNYASLQRLCHLHYLNHIVLANSYLDRSRRRLGRLDQVFTDFFHGKDVDKYRKLRQWMDRRLRRRSPVAN